MKHPLQKLLLILAGWLAWSGPASAEFPNYGAPTDENEPWGKLHDRVVTPHTQWATELAGPPIRIIAISQERAMREMVELRQRLACEIIPVMAESEAIFVPKDEYMCSLSREEKIQEVLKRLATKTDVILIGCQYWNSLDAEIRYALLKKIHDDGVTLIYIGPNGMTKELETLLKRPVAEEKPTGALFGVLDHTLKPLRPDTYKMEVRRFGKGRLMTLKYAEGVPPYGWQQRFTYGVGDSPAHEPKADETCYDYKQALLAKLVLWATNRLGPARITELRRNEPGFVVDVEGEGPVRGRLRNALGETVKEWPAAATTRSVALPKDLMAGTYVFDAWLLDRKGKVQDFASAPLEVSSCLGSGKLTFDVELAKPGTPFRVKLDLPQELPAESRVEWLVQDTQDRTFDRVEKTGPGKTFEERFVLPAELITDLIRVEAVVTSPLAPRTRLVNYLPTPRDLPMDEFYLLAWSSYGPGNVFLMYDLFRNEKSLGLDGLMGPSAPPDLVRWYAYCGLKSWPYITRVNPESVTANIRTPCLHDPEYLKKEKQKLEALGKPLAPYAPIAYNFGDESALGDEVCLSSFTQTAFQEAMRVKYGDLSKANAAWKTEFKSWTEVKGELLAQANQRGKFGLYLDFRLFMARSLADTFLHLSEFIHAFDPEARTGWEGIFGVGPNFPFDHPYLGAHLNFLGAYTFVRGRDPKEFIRSFARKGSLLGGWVGDYPLPYYYGDKRHEVTAPNNVLFDRALRYEPWNYLMHGFNSIWWYEMGRPLPQLEPLPYFQATLDEVREIKRGLGRLILNCERQDDRVAFYYDLTSMYGGLINGNPAYSPLIQGLMWALEAQHLQYRCISGRDLADGPALRKRFDLLVLPQALILSDQQVAGIQKFVAEGGKLLADETPGIRDEHGDRRETSPLAAIFSGNSGRIIAAPWGEYTDRSNADRQELLDRMRKALVDLDIRAPVTFKPDLPQTEVVRFASGEDEYLFVSVEPDANEARAVLTLPHQSHVYDLRAAKYLGQTAEIPLTAQPGRTMAYALLSSKPRSLKAAAQAVATRQGWEVALEVSVNAKEGVGRLHVVRLEVRDPQGQERVELARNLLLPQGALQTRFFLPQSEPSGTWRLDFRDVASGLKQQVKLPVPSR